VELTALPQTLELNFRVIFLREGRKKVEGKTGEGKKKSNVTRNINEKPLKN